MNQEKEKEAGQGAGETERRPFPRWKKITIALAMVSILAGVGLQLLASPSTGGGGDPRDLPPGSRSLVAGSPDQSSSSTSTGGAEVEKPGLGKKISPFLIHGGVSFFVGLAIGAAVRAFVKVALIVAGVILLGYFGLTYSGAVSPINWTAVEEWLVVQIEAADKTASGFQDHLLKSLPSAGMAGAGLVTGFKRK